MKELLFNFLILIFPKIALICSISACTLPSISCYPDFFIFFDVADSKFDELIDWHPLLKLKQGIVILSNLFFLGSVFLRKPKVDYLIAN